MNQYLLGIRIEGSLSSSIGDIHLKSGNIPVTLNFSSNNELGYFSAFLEVEAPTHKIAHQNSLPVIDEVCDVVSFAMKSSLMPVVLFTILKDEADSKERVTFRQTTEQKFFGAWFHSEENVKAIQELIDYSKDDKSNLALRWLRYGYRSRGYLEQFTYYWLALERLAGEKLISKICKCGENLSYVGTDKDGIWKMLINRLPYKSFSRDDFEGIWKLRQQIFHGGKKPDIDFLSKISKALPILQEVIEKELRIQFQPKLVIGNETAFPASRLHHIRGFYKFNTKNHSEKFAMDFPSDQQLLDFHKNDEARNSDGLEVLNFEEFNEW